MTSTNDFPGSLAVHDSSAFRQAAAVRALRVHYDLTARELCEVAGCWTQQYISALENGDRRAGDKTRSILMAVCEQLAMVEQSVAASFNRAAAGASADTVDMRLLLIELRSDWPNIPVSALWSMAGRAALASIPHNTCTA